jgi:glycosyltransferase involved in cell wall biosynthesis
MPLRIAGHIVDDQYFEEQIRPRLDLNVQYIGHLPRENLAVQVSHAALSLVTPCWDEPFGLVVAESLACGTPVAAFARAAITELASPETVALALPGNVESLTEAIGVARTLSRQKCRSRAEGLWDIETMVSRYEALLHQVQRDREEFDAGDVHA